MLGRLMNERSRQLVVTTIPSSRLSKSWGTENVRLSEVCGRRLDCSTLG